MKLDQETINKINSYDKDKTDKEVAQELGIHRHTVGKYRNRIQETLKLSKADQEKQNLVKTYTPEELREILNHVQVNTSRSIEKIIGDKGHLKFALIGDTHLGNKQAAKKELADFYKRA